MPRYAAKLVLLLLLWGCVAPALLVASDADLPACCRDKGKHHCAMMAAYLKNDGSPSLRSQAPSCPYRNLGSIFSNSPVAEVRQEVREAALNFCEQLRSVEAGFRAALLQLQNCGRSPPGNSTLSA